MLEPERNEVRLPIRTSATYILVEQRQSQLIKRQAHAGR